ncbi:hypothetical protein FHS07_001488 [Microbacterium proteolyticum]|uniref:Uncharacterized protein n=1 Tax=Microbacterium proteolyticum TaxID=1572644 RepID=A0A7W5CJ74_9MICO|nr:hypothetical protein [Microbacterium proteolyticum]
MSEADLALARRLRSPTRGACRDLASPSVNVAGPSPQSGRQERDRARADGPGEIGPLR